MLSWHRAYSLAIPYHWHPAGYIFRTHFHVKSRSQPTITQIKIFQPASFLAPGNLGTVPGVNALRQGCRVSIYKIFFYIMVASACLTFRPPGILAQFLVSYLLRLGWSLLPGQNIIFLFHY